MTLFSFFFCRPKRPRNMDRGSSAYGDPTSCAIDIDSVPMPEQCSYLVSKCGVPRPPLVVRVFSRVDLLSMSSQDSVCGCAHGTHLPPHTCFTRGLLVSEAAPLKDRSPAVPPIRERGMALRPRRKPRRRPTVAPPSLRRMSLTLRLMVISYPGPGQAPMQTDGGAGRRV